MVLESAMATHDYYCHFDDREDYMCAELIRICIRQISRIGDDNFGVSKISLEAYDYVCKTFASILIC